MPAHTQASIAPRRTRVSAERTAPSADIYDDGRLRVEHGNYYVACDDQSIRLPRKEFLIVSRLVRNAERVVAAEEIWRAAWGDGSQLNAESLHVHIYRLRRKLAAHNLNIETMVGVGYRLVTASGR